MVSLIKIDSVIHISILKCAMLCKQWMENLEAFQAAIESDSSYHSTLTRSLSLVLDEFYKNLRSVGVSAVSGTGMEAFFSAIEASADEYMDNYKYRPRFRIFHFFFHGNVKIYIYIFFVCFYSYFLKLIFHHRADLDKRWAEKERLEEELRQENMDKLRRGMEESDGNTMVLSRGLKDEGVGEIVMDEEEEEFELFSEEEEKDEA